MTHTGSAPHYMGSWGSGWWQSILLGIVFIGAGLFMLQNAVAATVISAIVFGIALLVVGLFEVVQSFWAPSWGGFLWRLLVGVLYAIAGAILVADPLAASIVLTLGFAFALIASGGVRVFQAFQFWERLGWLLLASGIVGILAGTVILLKWPISGLWVFGFVVGIDLILHGSWWIANGVNSRHEPRAA